MKNRIITASGLAKAVAWAKTADCGVYYITFGTYKDNGNDMALVFTPVCENGLISVKIAYNSDDMQCDFDWDWYYPCGADGDLDDKSWDISPSDNLDDLADEFDEACREAKSMYCE